MASEVQQLKGNSQEQTGFRYSVLHEEIWTGPYQTVLRLAKVHSTWLYLRSTKKHAYESRRGHLLEAAFESILQRNHHTKA